MEDYGLVSIIMPNWNCSNFIGHTIESVLAQTYQNWELLIQDDCSNDNSEEIIKSYLNECSRIKYARNKNNSGAAVTRNNALRRAKGHWIAFLDSDDLWLPEKLENQLKFMVKNGYNFTYTGYQEINNDGCETGVHVVGPKHVKKFGMYAFCWCGCLTVMYNCKYYGLLQIVDIKKNNDYAMWLNLCQKSDCYLLDECLGKYRRGRSGSISTDGFHTLIRWHYKLWHEAMGFNPMLSFFWTSVNLVCGFYKKIRYVEKH
ncbi:glycosyltransferase family 2 protein [Bacteroides reticulotermitis]|uniref:N-acetylgalactosaminyl-diphosphoundecaprenol glucuronosyltransferase n=2 Tax=Bacteroides reticulotermitis TaxID=1133319 RepID=W4UYJ0_9BACE|nr:glycosyltransferase family 2 protein [Bacteroides reticulotermitis]MBB4045520.1 glycosyltransferase involved in cell wall biosynthesis [Bacteroides reticulotermitis]GAE85991.1 N-acetylgalactosaminyl-diphosphoundecaprenol glucuronosyltransferase [Bacteroides reticulotermitis JCM 10512]